MVELYTASSDLSIVLRCPGYSVLGGEQLSRGKEVDGGSKTASAGDLKELCRVELTCDPCMCLTARFVLPP